MVIIHKVDVFKIKGLIPLLKKKKNYH